MEFTGTLADASIGVMNGKMVAAFEINETKAFADNINKIKKLDKLKIDIKKYREKRSRDANAYLWHLLGLLADKLNEDLETDLYTKENMYISMLQKYGRCITLSVPAESVSDLKKLWKYILVVGQNKNTATVQCFIGSSNYDTKEMSILINGVVEGCKIYGIPTKSDQELDRLLEEWGESNSNVV